MSFQHQISPQWVLVDRVLCYVSNFSHDNPFKDAHGL
jgi:hypothetical protein